VSRHCSKSKVKKVKWFRYRPGVAQRVGRGIALLFHDCGTRRGWVASRRLGGPQGRSGRAENLVATGIRSRTVQPVVGRYTDLATRLPDTAVQNFNQQTFNYLGKITTNQNYIQEEIKSRLNLWMLLPQSDVLPVVILKKKVELNLKNHNFTSCFVWFRKLPFTLREGCVSNLWLEQLWIARLEFLDSIYSVTEIWGGGVAQWQLHRFVVFTGYYY